MSEPGWLREGHQASAGAIRESARLGATCLRSKEADMTDSNVFYVDFREYNERQEAERVAETLSHTRRIRDAMERE